MYDNLKYEADAEAEISPKEALDLLGKNVIYEGKKKMLRRLYKTVSDRKTIVYDVEVQEITAPYTLRRCAIGKIKKDK